MVNVQESIQEFTVFSLVQNGTKSTKCIRSALRSSCFPFFFGQRRLRCETSDQGYTVCHLSYTILTHQQVYSETCVIPSLHLACDELTALARCPYLPFRGAAGGRTLIVLIHGRRSLYDFVELRTMTIFKESQARYHVVGLSHNPRSDTIKRPRADRADNAKF